MRRILLITSLTAPLLLGGCVARTAFDVVTAPVRVASKAVDMATTSQSEKDEKAGREARRADQRLGKLQRQYEDQLEDCEDGKEKACRKARETYAEIRLLLPPSASPASSSWEGGNDRGDSDWDDG